MPGYKLMRCPVCKGTVHTCKCQDEGKTPMKGKANKKNKNFTKNGANWCGKCNCQLNPSGVCSNLTCSTRKGK
jgi:hypothetical protein